MGRPTVIKAGDVYGALEVVAVKTFGAGRNAVAVCRCACGTTKDVKYVHLKKIRSCGCRQHDQDDAHRLRYMAKQALAAQPVQPAVNEQLLEALKFAYVLLKDQCMDTALVKLKIETAIAAAEAEKGGV